ncbi:MAG: pilus assembly protein [Deltaproteobacteria bacterium]|nr:pilus assembly protein [Deltaproteobacteria bacterium]
MRWSWRRLRQDESGQAVVESAIVIPLMTFVILGILQLVMVQHARIMTEYAAFNSARAGIVWNADKRVMENAAIIALLPTHDGLAEAGMSPMATLQRIMQKALLYQINRNLAQGVALIEGGAKDLISQIPDAKVLGTNVGGKVKNALSENINDVTEAGRQFAEGALTSGLGKLLGGDDRTVRVDILNPHLGALASLGNLSLGNIGNLLGSPGGHFSNNRNEVDFDNFDVDASRLTIRIRYMYMMRIPFANWVIHSAWLAGQAGRELYGAVWNPQTAPGATGFANVADYTGEQNTPSTGLLSKIQSQDLKVATKAASGGVYMLPIYATYTMRMQSNPYRSSVQQ